MQGKIRKIMNEVFILRPWGFVVFLLIGISVFFVVTTKIHIPVYRTVETTAVREGGMIRVDLHKNSFEAGTPVFLYESRDDHLEKVAKYKVEQGCPLIEEGDKLPVSGKVYLDIQIGDISLLRHILTEGGNI